MHNFHAEQPYQHAIYYCQILRAETAWTKKERYDALPGEMLECHFLTSHNFMSNLELTLESLTEFIPVLLSKLHVEALCYGNITKEGKKLFKPKLPNPYVDLQAFVEPQTFAESQKNALLYLSMRLLFFFFETTR